MYELMKLKKQLSDLKLELVRAYREKNRHQMRLIFSDIKTTDKTIQTLENIGASMDRDRGFTCGY